MKKEEGSSDKQTVEKIYYKIRIISKLVVESLVYFQCKVAQIMEPICFAFNNFYFVIDPFEFTGMNGVIAVVEDSVTITI